MKIRSSALMKADILLWDTVDLSWLVLGYFCRSAVRLE